MKIKKTIAAIAAATMVFTALPMAAFAVDEPPAAGTVDEGASGTVEKGKVVDGKQEYTVAISSGEGEAELGAVDGRKNYHVVIPMEDLTTGWKFDASSQYQYDYDDATAEQKAFNISNGELKLWLPITSNYCNVVLTGPNGEKKNILISTVNGSAAEKPPAAHTLSDWKSDGVSHWKECTEVGCTSGGMVNAGVHTYTDGKCSVCGKVDPATIVSSSSSSTAVASTGASVDTPAASAADVKTASKAEVKVDASATKVTPAMVTAFANNAKTKTLTLEYGSTVKVAVAKDDLKDAAKANLDFSVSGKKILSDAAIKSNKTLANAAAIAQMNFVQEGKFNGIDKVTVKNRVGAKFVGQKATVYEYVDGKLVKVAETKVGGSGLVSFKIDHFGKYVIVVEPAAKGATQTSGVAGAAADAK